MATTSSTQTAAADLTVREIGPDDIPAAGRFIYEAFKGIGERHNFPIDFPNEEAGIGFAKMWIEHPQIYGVAAEENGRFVGSNFLTEMDPIRAVGPITVDPEAQTRGIGRKLMQSVIERGKAAPGIRLVQDAFNTLSLSLYTSLGFDSKEPLALMQGTPRGTVSDKVEVRRMTACDLEEVAALCRRVHGFERTGELRDALKGFAPYVAFREGRIVAYASTVTFWQLNHGVAETDRDMQDLLIGAANRIGEPLSLLLPIRRAEFHRWALTSGLRMVKPMTLMAMGEYQEPRGVFFPSVLY